MCTRTNCKCTGGGRILLSCGAVTQWVERGIPVQEVIGSYPVAVYIYVFSNGQYIFRPEYFGQQALGTGSQRLLYLNKTTNCSVVYCGAHLETTNPSRMYCGKKAQAVPLHVTLSHLHSVVYHGKARGIQDSAGDCNYFNLKDEESRRAAGGGRNHNAPAWDPEKMELRRIVDRLLEDQVLATQVGGADSASQSKAATVLGEGHCRLVQAGVGRPGGSHDINHYYLFIIFWPKENELGDQSNKKIIQQGQNVLSHLFCGHFSFTLVFFVGRHAVEEKRTVAIVCDNLQGVIHTLSYIPQAFPRYTTECRWDKLTWSFPHYILDGFGVSKQLQNILRNSLGFCASLIWLKCVLARI